MGWMPDSDPEDLPVPPLKGKKATRRSRRPRPKPEGPSKQDGAYNPSGAIDAIDSETLSDLGELEWLVESNATCSSVEGYQRNGQSQIRWEARGPNCPVSKNEGDKGPAALATGASTNKPATKMSVIVVSDSDSDDSSCNGHSKMTVARKTATCPANARKLKKARQT
ncbi:hypothetical protein FA15DRAFT_672228 [Coprinopsis marcescibilis]|uniref:Uncharacterized protein n=1 Tax=Coprinopsis marcescibilis TaxID=230819 RepID=A0A5C3L0M3_COPMA|nr:hypothetical protein FA15DRAFT_672228 [Coprinopsis marcescibilis]